jgi:hypothetical protein
LIGREAMLEIEDARAPQNGEGARQAGRPGRRRLAVASLLLS